MSPAVCFPWTAACSSDPPPTGEPRVTHDTEGRLRLQSGHEIWYQRVGDGPGVPLLILHGGPGSGHDYLEPLGKLGDERPVIFYDQLGCGRSDKPDDRSLWRIERFVQEVDEVRQALGLDTIHLFGQSWGGWLGIEYMLSGPRGVRSLILANTSASMRQFGAEAERLKSELPAAVYTVLQRYESDADYHNPEYEAAVLEFYKRHVCRLPRWPDCLLRTGANLRRNVVYETMNGPNEFTLIGNLKDWDRSDRLGEIALPTLVTVGRYDEITPACAETIHRGIAGSQLAIFEDSSHTPHLEEEEAYLGVLSGFLRDKDRAA